MFKKIFSISLILTYTFIIGANTIAFIQFKINQQYIAKNLCIQKDDINNLCMGSCYLKAIQKRLHENENQEKGTQPPNPKPPVQFETTLSNNVNLNLIFENKLTLIIEKDTPLERDLEPLTPPPKNA